MEKNNKKVDKFEIEPLSNIERPPILYAYIPKNDSQERHFISDRRRAISQYCASGALSLLMISFGMNFGFSTILIPELEKIRLKDENFITIDQLTWISSLNYIAIIFGSICSGSLSQSIGRRNALIVSNFPFIASWIILYMCGQMELWPIVLGLSILGFSGGIIESPLQVYVTEISEPKFRSSLITSLGVTIMIGFFIEVTLGKYLDWRTLALVNTSFPILALMSLFFMPESPYWLASKGRYEESLKALAWLRGWSPVSQLPQNEFQEIISTVSKKSDRNLSVKRYFKSSIMSPFLLVSFTFFVSCFNGTTVLNSWAIPIFEKIHSPVNAYTATIIAAALQLISTIILMLIFPLTGKRKVTLVSLIATGISLFVVAVYIFHKDENMEYGWIPTIGLLLSIGFSFLGIKNVPWIYASELFPCDVRSQMAGLLAGLCQVYSAVASKSYVYMEQKLTFPGLMLFFACINVFGLIVLYFYLPETEGKSLADIEQLAMDRKSRKKKLAAEISKRDP